MFDRNDTIAVIVSIRRAEDTNYIHRAIKNLGKSGFFERFGKLHVVLGSSDTSYLNCYKDDLDIVIHPMDSEEEIFWKDLYLTSKCAYGHVRMIKVALSFPGWKYAVLFEDDTIVARYWASFIEDILPEIHAVHRDNFMLSMYQHRGVKDHYDKGERWYPIDLPAEAPYYHGGLAEVHTRFSLDGMTGHINARCIDRADLPSDYAMGEYTFLRHGAVLATAPSLIQHIGKVSTGQSGGFHQSDLFMEDIRGIFPA
jgi:hypothetical protein